VDLAPAFPIARPGRYNITATVRIKGWEHEAASPPRGFDIISGLTLWQQEFGVPKAPGEPAGSPEVRRYLLQQANYGRGQVRLYLRVTDATGTKPLRVFPIGGMISFSRPEHLLDAASDLHVLYQDGAHSFNYTVFTPDGDLIVRQTYDYFGAWSRPTIENSDGKLVSRSPQEGIATRPRLKAEADGKVHVVGGVRRETPADVPPPKVAADPEAPKPLDPLTAPPSP
jgi:hypothetical protein